MFDPALSFDQHIEEITKIKTFFHLSNIAEILSFRQRSLFRPFLSKNRKCYPITQISASLLSLPIYIPLLDLLCFSPV